MPKLIIEGGHKLSGVVQISGAKNSVVAILPAAILNKGKSIIYNVPNIRDIEYLIKILELLECKVKLEDGAMFIDSTFCVNKPIPEELSREMRASYYFMGALLARFGSSEISYPGGCNIGSRPIDIHIKGFEELGTICNCNEGKYTFNGGNLKGKKILLDFPSVGATINIMLAATGAKGTTIIENAAREPEIVNVASFLINMGFSIEGAGTSTIKITPNKILKDAVTEIIPDRIEAITYLIIGALIGERLIINGAIKEHLQSVLIKLTDMNINYEITGNSIIISKCEDLNPINIKTLVYPGFPTDAQQPFTVLLTQAEGISTIYETIYETRYKNADYLNLMGANCNYQGNKLTVVGKTPLKGTKVFATDLRAGACLVIAGLIAEGTTTIDNIYHILRGYEELPEKLTKIGAKIKIVE